MSNWKQITEAISAATGQQFEPNSERTVSGGCINRCVQLSNPRASYFVKLNDLHLASMFAAESKGLAEISATGSIRTPAPICDGTTKQDAFLVLEYIPLASGRSRSQSRAGKLLAELHRNLGEAFGFTSDNYIGATPQPNSQRKDWSDFWRDNRLGFQLQLAARNGYRGRLQQRGELLLANFHALIDHAPQPSLIHGDLWGGNLSYDESGEPVIYDPAAYYGDREAEIAMTELFGGFNQDFYTAYNNVWPLDAGYAKRKRLYNLYHVLNHLNLFGGGYAGQALALTDSLLSDLGH